MQLLDYFNREYKQNELRKNYIDLVSQQPKTRQRDVAAHLGISEAALVDEQLGLQSIRLRPDIDSIIGDLPGLGYIMNLTRNANAVHERKGCYQNVSIKGKMGLVISNDKKIDLRLFLSKWVHVYAVKETLPKADRYSLQFFDASGVAIQKVFLQPESHLDHYRYMLERYVMSEPHEPISYCEKEVASSDITDEEIDSDCLLRDWQEMTDVHQFMGILRKHKVGRTQAFHLVGRQYAEEFSPVELERILLAAADMNVPIMCFVGNESSIQIFSGTIHKVKGLGPWLNILDPEFNLHLLESGIMEAWLVRKPTSDGIVTSLEFYDEDSQLIVQFFGKREEGNKENPLWTQLAESALLAGVPYKKSVAA